jgi:hypothetical protein
MEVRRCALVFIHAGWCARVGIDSLAIPPAGRGSVDLGGGGSTAAGRQAVSSGGRSIRGQGINKGPTWCRVLGGPGRARAVRLPPTLVAARHRHGRCRAGPPRARAREARPWGGFVEGGGVLALRDTAWAHG